METCSGVPGYESRSEEIWGEAEVGSSIEPGQCESDGIDEELDESRVLHVGTQNTKTTEGLQRGKIGPV